MSNLQSITEYTFNLMHPGYFTFCKTLRYCIIHSTHLIWPAFDHSWYYIISLSLENLKCSNTTCFYIYSDSHSAKPDWWLGGMGHLSSHKWQTYLWPCLKSNWSWGRVLHRQWTGLCFTSPPSPSIMSLSICELYQCFSTLVRNNHPHFQPGHHWVLGRSCSQTCSKRFSQEHLRVIPYLQKWPAQGHRRHTWLMLVPLNIFI
jgi:hypothetical protein